MKTKKASIEQRAATKRHGLQKSWRFRVREVMMTAIAIVFTLAPLASIGYWAFSMFAAQQ